MKTNNASSLKCPDRMTLPEDEYFYCSCITINCMAWVVTECQPGKPNEGYCTRYGKESESQHYYTDVQNMPRVSVDS